MVLQDEKLLSTKMIVMAFFVLKFVLNGFALMTAKLYAHEIIARLDPHGSFIYRSLETYKLYFSVDSVVLLCGVLGYLLFYRHRWVILQQVLLISLVMGLVLSGRIFS